MILWPGTEAIQTSKTSWNTGADLKIKIIYQIMVKAIDNNRKLYLIQFWIASLKVKAFFSLNRLTDHSRQSCHKCGKFTHRQINIQIRRTGFVQFWGQLCIASSNQKNDHSSQQKGQHSTGACQQQELGIINIEPKSK